MPRQCWVTADLLVVDRCMRPVSDLNINVKMKKGLFLFFLCLIDLFLGVFSLWMTWFSYIIRMYENLSWNWKDVWEMGKKFIWNSHKFCFFPLKTILNTVFPESNDQYVNTNTAFTHQNKIQHCSLHSIKISANKTFTDVRISLYIVVIRFCDILFITLRSL